GFYGSITQQAVIDFQQRNGLPANGVAGPETLTILYDDTRAVSAVSLLAPVSVLQFNSSGAEVVRLQNRLKELSYLSADTSTNGYYGLETQQAIIEFQQKNGLMGDGVAGPQTLNILYSNSAVVSDKALTPTVLKLESTGPEVVDLQNRLKVLGYLPAAKASDGYFGLDTQLAVTEFQRKHGLTVDGIAGQATLDLLKSGRAIAAGPSITVDGAIAAGPSTTVARVMEVATLGSDLRVREGPSQDTRVLNFLPNGSFIRTTGRTSNGWIQLEDGGWVFGDMVK
ncbi:MAG: peptidoglycan-binding protein, partial [Pseudanabaenales cyanobacterium]|nr:peptidoglycan-binding protein [Pseudanabaenales cyanobacterium]